MSKIRQKSAREKKMREKLKEDFSARNLKIEQERKR